MINTVISFKLDQNVIKRLRELNNNLVSLYGSLKILDEEEKMAIQKYARISNIGASTRIENALLTNSEIHWIDTILTKDGKVSAFNEYKDIIQNKLSKDRERSIEEVAGCRSMMHLIYGQGKDFIPLTETVIKALHYELMFPYSESRPHIGVYKKNPNYVIEQNQISNESRIIFKTADAGPITEVAMKDLVEWYNKSITMEPWGFVVASEFVYRFLAIHPFQDGNGRLGRGLFSLCLLQSRDIAVSELVKYLAIDRQIEKHKEEYYFVLNKCSKGKYHQDASKYNIEYFLIFMLKVIENSLHDIEVYRLKYRVYRSLSEAGLKVYNCFQDNPEIKLGIQKIHSVTSLPRRTINYAITTLLQGNLIQKYGQGAGTRYQITF